MLSFCHIFIAIAQKQKRYDDSYSNNIFPSENRALGVSNHRQPTCLTHWGREKNAAFSQTTFLHAFLWMKFVPKVPNNIQALVQIIAWHRPGDKPLSESLMVSLLMHIWVSRPQWINSFFSGQFQRKHQRGVLQTRVVTNVYRITFGHNCLVAKGRSAQSGISWGSTVILPKILTPCHPQQPETRHVFNWNMHVAIWEISLHHMKKQE